MLLHQVLNDEPTPARASSNDRIPRDLETICLKAMAKEPARRYATAGDLAADLRRWLSGEPIQARPIGSFERAWRWAKRNRTVASLLAALALVFSSGFAGVTVAYFRSEHFRNESELRRQEAVGQGLVAEARRKEAETNFDQAIAAVDDFLTKVGNEKLLDAPGLMPLRRDLLTSALAFYQRFLDQRKGDPRFEPRVAAAYLSLAKIKSTLGPEKESQEAARLAQQTYARLFSADPGDREVRAGLAKTLQLEGSYPEAIAHWETLVKEEPASVRYRQGLAESLNVQGIQLANKGQQPEALATYQKALVIFEALATERPNDPEAVHGVSYPYNNIGVILYQLGRYREALEQYQRAVEASRKAVLIQPASYQYRRGLGLELNNLATQLRNLNRNDDAVKAFSESIQVRRGLVRDFAFFPAVHQDLYQSYHTLAYLYRAMGRTEEAGRMYRSARDIFANLSHATADDLYLQSQVIALCAASDREQAQGAKDPAQAREFEAEAQRNTQQSMTSLKRAVSEGFSDLDRFRSDANAAFASLREDPDFQAVLGDLVVRNSAKAKPADLAPVKAAIERSREEVAKSGASRDTRATLAANLHAAGVITGETAKTGEALTLLRQAREIREALVRERRDDEFALVALAQSYKSLGDLLVKNFTGKLYQSDSLAAAQEKLRACDRVGGTLALSPARA